MDFIDRLHALAAKIPAVSPRLQTEEATKNALIMPFIAALGYDVFDPMEVVPEFIADHGIKKGEKVDYAIVKDEKIIMIWECKRCGGDLSVSNASQLFRYFGVTETRVAVLTNGVQYRFFSDLEAANKMDEVPFLEVDMTALNESVVTELKKLTKPAFNIDELLSGAADLKYTREIKRLLSEQLEAPSDEFVKMFASKVFTGMLTPQRREYFGGLTQRAFKTLLSEQISQRLQNAMGEGAAPVNLSVSSHTPSQINVEVTVESPSTEAEDVKRDLVVTTEDELQGFYMIKAILRQHVEPSRITARDTQFYFGILLDDNNRSP